MEGANHITREVNGVTHRLAKKVLFFMDEQVYMKECPLCIFDIINNEHCNF
jgi:hypothetical protein